MDTVERLVRDEAIDCDFLRHGKLKLATRPSQMAALERSAERLIGDGVDTDVEILDAARVRAEVQSERFHGGLLYKRSGQMHMGRFAQGLAAAAERNGAQIHTGTACSASSAGPSHAHGCTRRGTVSAQQVLLATGATRHGGYGSFGWLRRRIVPIGSFIVVTEPLGAERAQALLGRADVATTSTTISGSPRPPSVLRRRVAVSSPQSDAASGEILRAGLADLPAARQRGLDYCWGGLVDMTQDRLPHAGERNGLYYAMGYSGHGTQMSVHMGERMAAVMGGDALANPWHGATGPPSPANFGSALVPAGGRPVLHAQGPAGLSAILHRSTKRRQPMNSTSNKSFVDGHTSKLKGLSPIPLGGLMGYNFAENVWLEA